MMGPYAFNVLPEFLIISSLNDNKQASSSLQDQSQLGPQQVARDINKVYKHISLVAVRADHFHVLRQANGLAHCILPNGPLSSYKMTKTIHIFSILDMTHCCVGLDQI